MQQKPVSNVAFIRQKVSEPFVVIRCAQLAGKHGSSQRWQGNNANLEQYLRRSNKKENNEPKPQSKVDFLIDDILRQNADARNGFLLASQ